MLILNFFNARGGATATLALSSAGSWNLTTGSVISRSDHGVALIVASASALHRVCSG